MKLQNLATLAALVPYALGFPNLADFPEYRSLAGLSPEEIQTVIADFPEYRSLAGLSPEEVQIVMENFDDMPGAQPLPPPISYTGPKLVNDAAHPFEPLRPGDIRGPCPGLNTLASHGYLNRRGVVTPAEIITAVQEGYNLGYHFAGFLCFSAFILDGNHLTNMMSLGKNTTTDHFFTPGINTHGTFEGDGSITRQDKYFGNNFLFRESLFDVLEHAAHEVGHGQVTVEAAALDRALRVNDSIARNPQFAYETPRILGATAESAFMIAMFRSNQTPHTTLPLTLDEARHFFDLHRLPEGFHRRQAPFDFPQIEALTYTIIDLVGIKPGHNEGVNNYVVNPEDPVTFCYFYQKQVNLTAQLYPNPPPKLRAALKANINTYYHTLGDSSCQQLFPFGH